MSKYYVFPNGATEVLKNSSKFKEYTRKMESMPSKEEFVKTVLLRDFVSFMESEIAKRLSYSEIKITWDSKEWERVCKEKPFVRDSFGAVQVFNKTVKLIIKPETAERWVESWFPQLYFFRFIIHELFHAIFPNKSEREAHKFTDLIAMEKFWEVEFSKEDKIEIEQQIENL